jgi:hypothetical protein
MRDYEMGETYSTNGRLRYEYQYGIFAGIITWGKNIWQIPSAEYSNGFSKEIQDDSKLLSAFSWPIKKTPDNNLESLCICEYIS